MTGRSAEGAAAEAVAVWLPEAPRDRVLPSLHRHSRCAGSLVTPPVESRASGGGGLSDARWWHTSLPGSSSAGPVGFRGLADAGLGEKRAYHGRPAPVGGAREESEGGDTEVTQGTVSACCVPSGGDTGGPGVVCHGRARAALHLLLRGHPAERVAFPLIFMFVSMLGTS